MKLAEALILRGNLQSKLNELRGRLNNNSMVQEGEDPAEDPKELLNQVNNITDELEKLVAKINLTNAKLVSLDVTMTELLAKRDALREKIRIYREFLDNASSTGRRARGSEIKIKSTVNVSSFQKEIDRSSAELRELEVNIQSLNWTNDLLD